MAPHIVGSSRTAKVVAGKGGQVGILAVPSFVANKLVAASSTTSTVTKLCRLEAQRRSILITYLGYALP